MAWNPSHEVAVARDAAKALNDAPVCVVLWVTKDGKSLGMASYGRTMELCAEAKKLGQHLFTTAKYWDGEPGKVATDGRGNAPDPHPQRNTR